ENFLGHFVYGIDARHVETVICQGRVIAEQGKVTQVNEDEVLAFSKEMGKKLWDKM
ncbi:MAG: amidohydrolase, partial [Desulfobacteraceae bacterium]|nr:amidohydrolase [Desulfobacteraceae bacterium]